MKNLSRKINRRQFLKESTTLTASAAGVSGLVGCSKRKKQNKIKKMIVIGFDGMDPRLTERMMNAGQLPTFATLYQRGGYRVLGTSIPPQSPVAWSNFINGAGPGSHGIFDFIHRHPENQCTPYFSIAETFPAEGYWGVGEYKVQLNFWPFSHTPSTTVLRRQGVPFWDYLDEAGIPTTFYNLPSNYPPSPSKHGNHRCLSGMGVPDMLGTYGTYQHYAEDGPVRPRDEGGGWRSMLFFEDETAKATLVGPPNSLLKHPKPLTIDFLVHRDQQANAAVIEIQKHKILLQRGQWSKWINLDFNIILPNVIPNKALSGICRFYLQEVSPNFRLYVTPINVNPSDPAITISEPMEFIADISRDRGLFYTTGFQEDHKALSNKVFSDDEFVAQSGYVLEERLALLEYALRHYDDGLLYFYFSSTDLQSHMFWWDSQEQHPVRTTAEARHYFEHLQKLYQKIDDVMDMIISRYGAQATIIALSDHGFANFKRQFNLNTWLRENGYLGPKDARDVLADVEWPQTRAYGMGINGLYLNLKGRERYGIVELGEEREALLEELVHKLEAVRDVNGQQIIRKVHRADKAYSGKAIGPAPDLIIGYTRGYRASWSTCLGNMDEEILSNNTSAWSADHCADVSEVPGILFCNRPITGKYPKLIDIAPTIINEYGLKIPSSMTGKNILA